jgi:DNA invertase Pin-like site-specific DNA recombinase
VIRHLDELLLESRKWGKKLLLVSYMRVSTWEQRKNQNEKNRRRLLKLVLRQRNIQRINGFSEVTSGKLIDNRPELANAIEAVRKAQAEKPDALVAVVTDTRDRFIRGEQFNRYANTDPPQRPAIGKSRKTC